MIHVFPNPAAEVLGGVWLVMAIINVGHGHALRTICAFAPGARPHRGARRRRRLDWMMEITVARCATCYNSDSNACVVMLSSGEDSRAALSAEEDRLSLSPGTRPASLRSASKARGRAPGPREAHGGSAGGRDAVRDAARAIYGGLLAPDTGPITGRRHVRRQECEPLRSRGLDRVVESETAVQPVSRPDNVGERQGNQRGRYGDGRVTTRCEWSCAPTGNRRSRSHSARNPVHWRAGQQAVPAPSSALTLRQACPPPPSWWAGASRPTHPDPTDGRAPGPEAVEGRSLATHTVAIQRAGGQVEIGRGSSRVQETALVVAHAFSLRLQDVPDLPRRRPGAGRRAPTQRP